ncbi:MAG: hypothetical protein ACLGI9_16520 [Thermoanaerobaculia bacterium]
MIHKKTLPIALGTAAGVAVCGLALRPWFLGWGATDEEVRGPWPGDEMTPDAICQATRAVTIHASADEIWPWLVQIGQDRGGFYSYTWLENLFGARMRNAGRILPNLDRKVGDAVWMTPKERYGGKGCMKVAALEPARSMVLVPPDEYEEVLQSGRAPGGCWTFILRPLDNGVTRLILRSRGAEQESLPAKLFDRLVFDPAHFIMERKMMLEIKRRAEARLPSSSARIAAA